MNKAFSERMIELRTRKGVSQKEAAESLGVSQALLSHYEKGIRECGLEFLCKAASYYDVSCDYLLGMTDSSNPFQEQFAEIDYAYDEEFRTSTMVRAAVMLHDDYAIQGSGKSELVKLYFALSIYNIALLAARSQFIPKKWFSLPFEQATAFSKAVSETLSRQLVEKTAYNHPKNMNQPLCIKTIIETSEKLLVKEAKKLSETKF